MFLCDYEIQSLQDCLYTYLKAKTVKDCKKKPFNEANYKTKVSFTFSPVLSWLKKNPI